MFISVYFSQGPMIDVVGNTHTQNLVPSRSLQVKQSLQIYRIAHGVHLQGESPSEISTQFLQAFRHYTPNGPPGSSKYEFTKVAPVTHPEEMSLARREGKLERTLKRSRQTVEPDQNRKAGAVIKIVPGRGGKCWGEFEKPHFAFAYAMQSCLHSYILSLELPQKVSLWVESKPSLVLNSLSRQRACYQGHLAMPSPHLGHRFSESHTTRKEFAQSQWYIAAGVYKQGRVSCETFRNLVIIGHGGSIYTVEIGNSYKSKLYFLFFSFPFLFPPSSFLFPLFTFLFSLFFSENCQHTIA